MICIYTIKAATDYFHVMDQVIKFTNKTHSLCIIIQSGVKSEVNYMPNKITTTKIKLKASLLRSSYTLNTSEVIPLLAIEAYKGSTVIAPLILKLGA